MTLTIRDKHRTLVEALYKATVEGKIKWEPSVTWNGFDVYLAGQTVNIDSRSGEYEADDLVVTIYNARGDEVDSIRDDEISLAEEPPKTGQFANHYLLMEKLHKMAKRQSRGADKAVDDILSALEGYT